MNSEKNNNTMKLIRSFSNKILHRQEKIDRYAKEIKQFRKSIKEVIKHDEKSIGDNTR